MTHRNADGPLIAIRALLATVTLLLLVAAEFHVGEIDPYPILVACLKALFAF